MAPKRCYEVGESSKPRAMTEEAKRRRQAYLEMWRNARNPNNELGDPVPPQTPEESHPAIAPALSSPEQLQDPDDKPRSNTEERHLVTSGGEKVQFKWGRCIGTSPDPEEEEEEEEEDPEEGDLEKDPEDIPVGEQQGDIEESEEDPEENFKEEKEEEVIIIEDDTEEEQEPMESSEDEEPWEIPMDVNEVSDEEEDEGNVDEPEAIERAPEERDVSDSEYQGFPSDDEL